MGMMPQVFINPVILQRLRGFAKDNEKYAEIQESDGIDEMVNEFIHQNLDAIGY